MTTKQSRKIKLWTSRRQIRQAQGKESCAGWSEGSEALTTSSNFHAHLLINFFFRNNYLLAIFTNSSHKIIYISYIVLISWCECAQIKAEGEKRKRDWPEATGVALGGRLQTQSQLQSPVRSLQSKSPLHAVLIGFVVGVGLWYKLGLGLLRSL